MNTTTKAPLTQTRAREILEDARMDIASVLKTLIESQQQAYSLINITSELYEGLLHEEAPTFELQTRIAMSA